MVNKSRWWGIVIPLFTIILALGCSNATDPVESRESINAAGELAKLLGAYWDFADTVTLVDDLTVIEDYEEFSRMAQKTAIDRLVIPSGVTLVAPAEVTLTAEKRGIITVESAGALKLDGKFNVNDGGRVDDSGTIIVGSQGEVTLASGGKLYIEATGAVDLGGKLDAQEQSTIAVRGTGSLKTVPGATLTVDAKAEITTTEAAKIEFDPGSTVTGAEYFPPVLMSKTTKINSTASGDDPKTTVTLVFKSSVNVDSWTSTVSTGWKYASTNGGTTWAFTHADAVPDETVLTVTVKNTAGKSLVVNTTITVFTISDFTRPTGDTLDRYRIEKYENGIAILQKLTDGEWAAPLNYDLSAQTKLNSVIAAIYTANRPGAVKSVENGKDAIPFDAALSRNVLDLFQIVVGATVDSTTTEYVEITSESKALFPVSGASATNLVVIDIGQPGQANNNLPTFYIPLDKASDGSKRGTLGDGSTSADYIRLRVNNGAELVILADNSGYISGGAGNSCPDGRFLGGCVEVMAGGKLRDGAYEGFPLGTGAVILNRSGSYLSVGPEATHSDATNESVSSAYGAYYAGYLVGPQSSVSADIPRIFWDGSQGTYNYLEVRPGVIATNARLTVQKNVGLIYSVWFLSGASLTIKGGEGENRIHLATNERTNGGPDYNFYFNGGVTLTMEKGAQIDKRFFETPGKARVADSFYEETREDGWTQTILAQDLTGSPVPYVNTSTRISGIMLQNVEWPTVEP